MFLYMGSGSALATYRREQQVRGLTECASLCGAASRRFAEQIELARDSQAFGRLALGIEAAGDCLKLCSLTASLMGRTSELSSFAFAPCAEACRRCAEACDALSPDDVATECADRCRRTERACREAAGQGSS